MSPSSLVTSNRLRHWLWGAVLVSGGVLVLGLAVAPDRVWSNMLVAAFFVLTLGLGGAVFLELTRISGARWDWRMRFIPRGMTALLPAGGILLLAVLALRLPRYSWHHHGSGDAGTYWFKELWLNEGFFAARAVMIVLLWAGLGRRMAVSAPPLTPQRNAPPSGRFSALFLVVFAATFSVASWDWLMALEPMWFSTIWGVYHFAGLMTATLAVVTLVGVASRRGGDLPAEFTDDHLHDVGQLLFGFSCFWMYIWYSQYMLIWYTNIPEEAVYFNRRWEGVWGPVVVVNVVLNFAVPFFALLPKPNKRSAGVMTKIAVVVLIGRWVDLSLMVFPSTTSAPQVGLWELAAVVLAGGLVCGFVERSVFGARRSSTLLAGQ